MRNINHMWIGVLSGFGLMWIFDINFFYVWPCIIGSVLPDILEPARDYTHRKFFHSKRVLKYIGILAVVTFLLGFLSDWFYWAFFGFLGYGLHLLADSTTPMGLPK